jgi:hypothetical protein
MFEKPEARGQAMWMDSMNCRSRRAAAVLKYLRLAMTAEPYGLRAGGRFDGGE